MLDSQIKELRDLFVFMRIEMNVMKIKPQELEDFDSGAIATIEAVESMLDIFESDNQNG